jgi:autotransporter-associated beta strand protein
MPSAVSFYLAAFFAFGCVVGNARAQSNTGPRPTGPNPQPTQPADSGYYTQLFSYGAAVGDVALPRNDDGFAYTSLIGKGVAGSSLVLPFYGESYSGLYVNNNGAISFNSGVSTYTGQSFPAAGLPPMIAPFWADVDTRPANGGSVWYRTATDEATLTAVGDRIHNSFLGSSLFNPTFVQVVTWDKVGYYDQHTDRVNTFQAVIASDGIYTYTMFLYPYQSIWWATGDFSGGTYPQVGFQSGTGQSYNAMGTLTNSVYDLWFLTNTQPAHPGTQIYRIDGISINYSPENPIPPTTTTGKAPLVVPGNLDLPSTRGTAADVVQFKANPLGHVITSTAAAGSLQFNKLLFDDPNDTLTINGSGVYLAYGQGAISHGNITITGSSVLVLDNNSGYVDYYTNPGSPNSSVVTGGNITLKGNAQILLYSATATSGGQFTFDNTGGGTGGTIDLRGFSTQVGTITSVGTGNAGHITNSGTAAATLTLGTSGLGNFGGVITDGTAPISLVKVGTGTQVLSGANTFTGTTAIRAGTLAIANGLALQGSTLVYTSTGGTLVNTVGVSNITLGGLSGDKGLDLGGLSLTVGGNNSSTLYSGSLTASTLTKTGSGTMSLTGANSALATTISGGALSIGNGGTTGSLSSYITISNSSAALVFNRSNNLTHAGTIAGSGTLVKLGTGTLTLTGYAGSDFTAVSAGTLVIGDGGTAGQLFSNVTNNGSVVFNRSDSTDFTRTMTGTGSVTKLGSGTLSITGTNTYTGVTRISEGTLALYGSLAGDVINNSSLIFSRSGSSTYGGVISGTGLVTKLGSGVVTLTGSNTHSGGTVINEGTLSLGDGGTAGSINGNITNNATLAFNRSNNLTYSGTISGANGLITKLGSGTLFLTGASTALATTVSDGALSIGDGGATGSLSSYITISNSTSSLIFNRSNNLTHNATIVGSGTLVKLGSGTLSLTGYAGTGSVRITSGALSIGDGGTEGIVQSNIVNNASLIFNRSNNDDYTRTISGNGSVTKLGSGTTTIAGLNTYTGATNIEGGTLRLVGANRLPTSQVYLRNGATLDLGGYSQSVGGIGANGANGAVGNITSGTITSNNFIFLRSGTFANDWAGNGNARIWVGGDTAATVVLSGANNMTYGDSNQLIIGHGTTGAAGTVKLGSAYAMAAANQNAQVFTGTLDFNGQGAIRGSGINLADGAGSALINSNTIAAASFAGWIVLTPSGTSQVGGAGDLTLSGQISRANGGVKKVGAGTLTLSGSNSYGGGTTIASGTVVKANNNAMGTGTVVVEGGVFQIAEGIAVGNNAVTLAGGEFDRALAGGASLANAVNATSRFAGGHADTTAKILQGTLANAATLSTSFSATSMAFNDEMRLSDVYHLEGTGSSIFVLELSMTSVEAGSYLGWLDTSSNTWVNAVEGNTGTNHVQFINGAYDGSLVLGHYGVDTANGTVWAVIDHNSAFAIVPEPTVAGLLVLGGVVLAARRRRKFGRSSQIVLLTIYGNTAHPARDLRP